MPPPLDAGLWHLRRSRSLKELRVLLRLIPKSTPGEDEEQHYKGAEYHDIIPIPASGDEGTRPSTYEFARVEDELRGDEQEKQDIGCVSKTVGERREQHTSFRVIEDPGVEKRGGNRDEEETHVVGEDERPK